MYTKEEKIQIVRFLEDTTIGATASAGMEYMTERELDDLIRICKVDPKNETSMQRVKNAMDRRDAYRAAIREARIQELRMERYTEANTNYDSLRSRERRLFINFVTENKETFLECVSDDFAWLDNLDLYPSVDFWTGELSAAVNEIACRLVFGKGNIANAVTASYTYDGVTNGPICSAILVDELDSEMKQILFWKYAKARLQYI